MKTADLIPLILLELETGDKYGLELTKNIEDRSNGDIIIKQPTLYTVLKKLEKSKFITSYWLDSDIGGKRHYYKITENGKAQASTLPKYEDIIANILYEGNEETFETKENPISEPIVPIIPSEEVFADTKIDTSTNQETNENNARLLNDNYQSLDFAENTEVTKFIETTPRTTINLNQSKEKNDILDLSSYAPAISMDTKSIKYSSYVNFKNDKNYRMSKLYTRYRILSSFVLSIYLLAIIGVCLIGLKLQTTKLLGSFMIIARLVAILYPAITVSLKSKIRKRAAKHLNRHSFLANIYLSIILLFAGFIMLEVYNMFTLRLRFLEMFTIKNFANFYAEMLVVFGIVLHSLVYNLLKIHVRKLYDTNS